MRILLLSAHIDDADTGCGASVAKFVEEGNEIHYAVFTLAEDSLPSNLSKDVMLGELKLAAKILGIKLQNLIIKKYPVRKFPQFRQEILEDLVQINKDIKPDQVFMPSKFDTHQDHAVIAEEGFRAFKSSSILCYEIPWNNISFELSAFISLKAEHVDKKIKALNCYESQRLREEMLGRRPINSEMITAWAHFRGHQIRVEYAEAFHVLRWIVK